MKTLVVIDLQKGLLAPSLLANPTGIASLVKNIADLMREFKYRQWPIVMVEFVQYDTPIIPELLDIVKDYKCWQLVKKGGVDGSDAILSQLRRWEWPLNFCICGIYGSECVAETVNGLIVKEPKARVEIMVDAVYPEYHTWGVNKDLHDK
ncbi:hypothetical protein LCGC14_1130340 [marine sediment metagenome]|uniref:Isochorismatase-like domain-containing protein n=1 Tax=marine sediment metagenome TaxID=412755 RepID=A0A0F9Q718_9ZZZZ